MFPLPPRIVMARHTSAFEGRRNEPFAVDDVGYRELRENKKMPSTSSRTNGHRLKKKRAARAKTARSAQRRTRAAPLNAQRDATRIQELQRKPRKTNLERGLHEDVGNLGLDVAELVNRRAKAILEFPMRVASCRSPLELWSTQTRFAQGFFSDYQSAAQRIMTHALHGLASTRNEHHG